MNEDMNEVLKHLNVYLKKWKEERETPKLTTHIELSIPTVVEKKHKVNYTTLWHHRLGHAPLVRINKIKDLKGFDQNKGEECLTCPVAKFTKLPYNKSESRAASSFDLVHMDTWGPYRVMTKQGHRYFLTILDDHIRVVWIHLIKTKDEALKAIVDLINMVSTQYNKKVKRIRTDNAPEYDDKVCRPFFDSLGIVHEISCVDSPEQNGRVEIRHRNLLEMARAMRFQSGVPLQYWGECVMAAIHVTNRLPTPVLHDATPYEVLNSVSPNYSTLKIFGCLIIARNPDKDKHKFKP